MHDDVLRDRARRQGRALSVVVRARGARLPLGVRARRVRATRAVVVGAGCCLFPLRIRATRVRGARAVVVSGGGRVTPVPRKGITHRGKTRLRRHDELGTCLTWSIDSDRVPVFVY